jgi:hypothetical protein
MEQCRLHLVTCFQRNHVLVACFVTMNCDFILWEFHGTFAIITCAGLNFELGVWSRESQLYDVGGGPGAMAGALLSLLLSSLSNILLLPLAQRHFQSMIVLGSAVLPLSQWSALSRAETPNCKIFIKILELLCILTKPNKFKRKLTHTHTHVAWSKCAILTHWHFVQFA